MPYWFEDLAYLKSYGSCSYAHVCTTLASTECVSILEPSNLLQLVCALGRVCFRHCHTAAWRERMRCTLVKTVPTVVVPTLHVVVGKCYAGFLQ